MFIFKRFLFFVVFLLFNFTLVRSSSDENVADEGSSKQTPDVQLFQKLFNERRQEHKMAVKSILNIQDYAKQYKMIELMISKVFQILTVSQETLRKMGFVPGDEFPENEDIRDALSQTFETTCLMGEVILHLPAITHKVIRKHDQHKTVLAWGVFFTAHSDFLPANTKQLVHLMSQELGLAEKDPNYINPYKKSSSSSEPKKKKEKKKKSFKKGPSLSRNFGDL